MYHCPSCKDSLECQQGIIGVRWVCRRCGGQAVGVDLLRRLAGDALVNQVWASARKLLMLGGPSCPLCHVAMSEAKLHSNRKPLILYLCRPCFFMWFEPQQYQEFLNLSPSSAREILDQTIVFRCLTCASDLRIQANSDKQTWRCPHCQDRYETLLDPQGVIRFKRVAVPVAQVEASCWEVLGVAVGASRKEIQEKYRLRIKEYHPDRVASLGLELRQLAEAKSKEINRAYAQALQSCGPEE